MSQKTGLDNTTYDILSTLGKDLIFYMMILINTFVMQKVLMNPTWSNYGKLSEMIAKSI